MNDFLYILKIFPWIFSVIFIVLNWKDFKFFMSSLIKKQVKKGKKPFTIYAVILLLFLIKGLDFIPKADFLHIPSKIYNLILIFSQSIMVILFIIWIIHVRRNRKKAPFTKTFIHKGQTIDDFLFLSIGVSLIVTSLSYLVIHPPYEPYEVNKDLEKLISEDYIDLPEEDKIVFIYKPINFEKIWDVEKVIICNNQKRIFCQVNTDFIVDGQISSIMPPGKYYIFVLRRGNQNKYSVYDIIQGLVVDVSDSDSLIYVIDKDKYLPVIKESGSNRLKIKGLGCSRKHDLNYTLFPNDMIFIESTIKTFGSIAQSSTTVNLSSILVQIDNLDTVYYSEMLHYPLHQLPVFLREGYYKFTICYDDGMKNECSFNLAIINDTIVKPVSKSLIINPDRIINFTESQYDFAVDQIYIHNK